MVRAPAPAVVVAVRVEVGHEVEAGQTVVVLESMKMETAVRAPFAGRVREVSPRSTPRSTPVRAAAAPGAARRRRRGGRRRPGRAAGAPTRRRRRPPGRALSLLAALQALITGYDVSAGYGRQLVAEYDAARGRAARRRRRAAARRADRAHHVRRPQRALPQPAVRDEEEADEQVHSPREHFHAYLHSLDVDREGAAGQLPRPAVAGAAALRRPRPRARPGARGGGYRIFLAQQRVADQLPAVAGAAGALADRRPSCRRRRPATSSAEVLDRLIVATQLRYPAVGDLARSRPLPATSSEPLVAAGPGGGPRRRPSELLAQLERERPRRRRGPCERVEALVASPEPLIRLLAQRAGASAAGPDPVARGAHPALLPQPRPARTCRVRCSTAGTRVSGRLRPARPAGCTCWSAMVADADDLAGGAGRGGAAGRRRPGPDTRLRRPLRLLAGPARRTPTTLAASCTRRSRRWSRCPRIARRVDRDRVRRRSATSRRCTFRPSPDGLAEDRVIRGMHPLTAQRLDLWRLKNFDGEPAALGRGHLPVPLRREGQPERRAAHRDGRGPRR